MANFSTGYKLNELNTKNIDNKTLVYIASKEHYVIGNLLENLVINTESKWEQNGLTEQLSQLPEVDVGIKKINLKQEFDNVETLAGTDVFHSGIMSRKVYKGGSYITTSFKVRVMDMGSDIKDGKSRNPRDAVKNMIAMISPEPLKTQVSQFAKILPKYVEQNTFGKVESVLQGVVDSFNPNATVFNAIQEFGQKIRNINDDGAMKTVFITVGDYFAGEMIIKSLHTTYSKEWTSTGPLYVDFHITAQTRQILDRNEVSNFLNISKNQAKEYAKNPQPGISTSPVEQQPQKLVPFVPPAKPKQISTLR